MKKVPQSYNVVAELNFRDYYSGESSMYDDIVSVKRDKFFDNERIIVLDPTVGLIAAHRKFIRLLTEIDIPYFFVNVFTCSIEILELYETEGIAVSLLDSNPVSIADNSKYLFTDSQTMCVNPWINTEITNDGSYSVCCEYRGKFSSNVSSDTVQEFMHSDEVKTIRHEMLAGTKPKGCMKCFNLEDLGVRSKRLRDQYVFREVKDNLNYRDTTIHSLDIKLGTTCNFACRICNETNSSKWFAEKTANHNVFEIVSAMPKTEWVTDPNSKFSKSLDYLGEVLYLQFTGGEPLLIKEHFAILDHYIATGKAKDISVHYNTNGSIYSNKVLDYARHFKRMEISFSIDDVDERFEYSRGGNWNDVDCNIEQYIKNKPSNMVYNVYSTVSIFNILYIRSMYDFCKKHNLPLSTNILHNPKYYNIQNLDATSKALITRFYSKLDGEDDQKFSEIVKPMLDYMNVPVDVALTQRLIGEIQKIDTIRNVSFAKTYPAMNEILRSMK